MFVESHITISHLQLVTYFLILTTHTIPYHPFKTCSFHSNEWSTTQRDYYHWKTNRVRSPCITKLLMHQQPLFVLLTCKLIQVKRFEKDSLPLFLSFFSSYPFWYPTLHSFFSQLLHYLQGYAHGSSDSGAVCPPCIHYSHHIPSTLKGHLSPTQTQNLLFRHQVLHPFTEKLKW